MISKSILLIFIFSNSVIAAVNLKLEKLGEKHWNATYEFDQPIKSISFQRQTNQFRHKNWKVKSEGIQIKVEDGKEIIQSDSEFSIVEFEFHSYYEHLVKDYEFFQPFTDGSELMFTGHFYLEGLETNLLILAPRESIIILGNEYRDLAHWTDPIGDGTYIYFGNIKAISTPDILGVIDPGLPEWLKERLHTLMPRLFSAYKVLIGYELKVRPLVFFSYNPKREGIGLGGGVLPGVVQLRVDGAAWQDQTEDLERKAAFLLAHESAHLWNSQLFNYRSGETAFWMHEGGANAFSYRVMHQLGILSHEDLYEVYSDELNQCINSISSLPLNNAFQQGKYKAYYTCGTIISILTEKSLQINSDVGFFKFWRQLFELNPEEGYGQENYFEKLLQLTKDTKLIRSLKKFTQVGVSSTKAFFKEELLRLGFNITEVSENELRIEP